MVFTHHRGQRIAGSLLLLSAVLTVAGPWLTATQMPWLHAWLPYDCATPLR